MSLLGSGGPWTILPIVPAPGTGSSPMMPPMMSRHPSLPMIAVAGPPPTLTG